MTASIPTEAPGPESEQKTAPVDVAIAVVSHNHSWYLEPLLVSLFGTTHSASFELTIVDNVGEPEIRTLVEERFPQVKLIVNEQRKGFSENNNMVICHTNARYRFLLNPDTEVRPGAIDALVAFMDAHPEVGACGPKLVYGDGRLQLSCRQFPTLGSFLIRRTPLRVLLRSTDRARRYMMADWDHDSTGPVDWLFGAAILARGETLDTVGGLDENMFLYSEDVDWCLRVRLAGWEIYYVPESVIVHHFDDEKYNRYFTRHRLMHYKSMLQFVCKHWRYCLRW